MSLLLAWTLRAAATIALGLLLALALRRRSAATRNLVLRATLAVALALPLIATFAPRVEVFPPAVALPAASSQLKSQAAPAVHASASPTPVEEGWSVAAGDLARPSTYGLVRRTAFESRFVSAPALLLAFWTLGSGLLILRWLVGVARLILLRRQAIPTDAPEVWRAAVPVPATYGRTILLPLESDAWPEARLRAAILHERAHVARRDWPWQTLAGLFAAVHWPNPLAWLLARSLRDTAEAAADDAALAHMAPSDYARELLAVAKAAGRVGPALAMARRGGVRDRVVGVLANGRERRAPTFRTGSLLFAAVGACGVAVAGVAIARRGEVRLLDVSDRSGARWDRQGRVLPRSRDVVANPGLGAPKDRRWVALRLDLGDPPEGRGVKIEVPSPAQTNGFGPVDARNSPVWVSLTAPEALGRTDVRVGLAEGGWREVPGSQVFPRRVRRVVGGARPQYVLSLDVPARYRGQEVRVSALRRDGTEPRRIGYGTGPSDAFVQVHGRPQDLASARLEHRPYRWTTIRDVALRPRFASDAQPQTSGTVRLVAVEEGDRAWTPRGTSLPPSTDAVPFRRSRDLRALTFRFERTGRDVPQATGVLARDFLHRTGRPVLVDDAFDEFEMVAPSPASGLSASGGGERREAAGGTYAVHPTFTREFAPGVLATDVRVRLSSGPMTVSDALARIVRTTRLAHSSQIDGRWHPGVRVVARVPEGLRGETVLLRAFDAKGLMLEGSSPIAPRPDGTVSVTYDVANPEEIVRFQWAHRTPEFVEFRDVRLRPDP